MQHFFKLAVSVILITVICAEIHAAGLLRKITIGVTRSGSPIVGWANEDYFDLDFQGQRILVVGGVHDASSTVQVNQLSQKIQSTANRSVAFVPDLYPDSDQGRAINKADLSNFYNSTVNPEFQYLVGWSAYHITDCVVLLRLSDFESVVANNTFVKRFGRTLLTTDIQVSVASLQYCNAIAQASAKYGIGLDVMQLSSKLSTSRIQMWMDSISQAPTKSSARLDFQKRSSDVGSVIDQLLVAYGRSMKNISYIPSLAIMAQYQHRHLGNEKSLTNADLKKLIEPHLRQPLPKNGSAVAGHLALYTAMKATPLDREFQRDCKKRILDVANLFFTEQSQYRGHAMMPFHSEMSDAVFMGGPILAIADLITREFEDSKYRTATISHLKACALMNQLDNGLYQHSPLDPTAWGRGNGFAALGASMCLSLLSPDIEGYEEAQQSFVRQIEALVKHQDATGSWHQVVDHPESYPEFTSTCMIASAISIGIKTGVLQREDYRQIIVQAQKATIRRIAPNGFINDVCTGTGKQKNLRGYLDREAIQGRNDRAGAMALLFLTLLHQ
jgi:unsaturated rhamnogalacturonyl hydrolase